MFETNDLVRIHTQPKNMFVQIKDEVGLVKGIQEVEGVMYAEVQTISLEGKMQGIGWVDCSCLEKISNPSWENAKTIYLQTQKKYEEEFLAYNRRYQERLTEVAKKYNVSKEVIKAIRAEDIP